MSLLENLSRCKIELSKSYSLNDWSGEQAENLLKFLKESFPTSKDFGADWELVFRYHLSDLLSKPENKVQ